MKKKQPMKDGYSWFKNLVPDIGCLLVNLMVAERNFCYNNQLFDLVQSLPKRNFPRIVNMVSRT